MTVQASIEKEMAFMLVAAAYHKKKPEKIPSEQSYCLLKRQESFSCENRAILQGDQISSVLYHVRFLSA